ncbi:MAG: 4-hydroxy-3-methylbut-2-enyl diphosphate reductase, partial [Prevotellamassilia sp.]|nr:4-hydroxy-3-methylbut-2-enyl diphosphate reductase [Prevotellamassilia sp.]
LIDATCPVVLQLQRRIKKVYDEVPRPQIVIYGKRGHAEVLGLVGQTDGEAIVIEGVEEAARLDFTRDTALFSQTTKSLQGFQRIVEHITTHIQPPARFRYFDTICRQVANRLPNIKEFASRHDAIIFVCGLKSSNGRVLFEACREVNPRSYLTDTPDAIQNEWLQNVRSIGICGATSTPKWLMEQCKEKIISLAR